LITGRHNPPPGDCACSLLSPIRRVRSYIFLLHQGLKHGPVDALSLLGDAS